MADIAASVLAKLRICKREHVPHPLDKKTIFRQHKRLG